MAISKDGQGHKDKYLDTSRKILSQEMLNLMLMCNMKPLVYIDYLVVKTNVNFFLKGQKVKRFIPTV